MSSPARSQLAAEMANPPSSRAAPSVGATGGKDEGLPGVAALTRGRAVRPNKADDAQESGAPPVVATRHDEPVQSTEALEVAAGFDRPGLASRPDAGIRRPVAPGADVAKPKPLLWIAAAVVLGVVLAVAGAAILMRQKPQDLAIKPPSKRSNPLRRNPRRRSLRESRRTRRSGCASSSCERTASGPIGRSGRGAATPAPEAPSAPAPPSAGRAAMLIASADNPQKPVVISGSTVWSLISPAPNQPATVAVKAEADIPDLKMHATMTLRKNTDPTLQATHTIDLKFSFAKGTPVTGFNDVVCRRCARRIRPQPKP